MSEDFYSRKMAWLDSIASDAELSPAAFRLAYILSGYMNRETGKAWPTQETLASKSGLTDRTVRAQIAALVAAGYLNCEVGGGRRKPNVYTISDAKTRTETSTFNAENPEGNFHVLDENPEPDFPLSGENPEISGQKPGSKLPTEPVHEPVPSSKAESTAARTAHPDGCEGQEEATEKVVPLRPIADPADFRARLFAEGLATLAAITGRKPQSLRGLLGKWLKHTRDDAKAVFRAIEDARDDRSVEPIARIEERLFGSTRRQPKSSFDPAFMFRRH